MKGGKILRNENVPLDIAKVSRGKKQCHFSFRARCAQPPKMITLSSPPRVHIRFPVRHGRTERRRILLRSCNSRRVVSGVFSSAATTPLDERAAMKARLSSREVKKESLSLNEAPPRKKRRRASFQRRRDDVWNASSPRIPRVC